MPYLGDSRIDYPENHIECDNRLSWFLPRLTRKYSTSAVLVILNKDHQQIAESYNKRWHNLGIMKAYSQGILMRDFSENDVSVCKDYVESVYEHLSYFSKDWDKVVHVDLAAPETGIRDVLAYMDKSSHADEVISYMRTQRLNKSGMNFKDFLKMIRYGLRNIYWDIRKVAGR